MGPPKTMSSLIELVGDDDLFLSKLPSSHTGTPGDVLYLGNDCVRSSSRIYGQGHKSKGT